VPLTIGFNPAHVPAEEVKLYRDKFTAEYKEGLTRYEPNDYLLNHIAGYTLQKEHAGMIADINYAEFNIKFFRTEYKPLKFDGQICPAAGGKVIIEQAVDCNVTTWAKIWMSDKAVLKQKPVGEYHEEVKVKSVYAVKTSRLMNTIFEPETGRTYANCLLDMEVIESENTRNWHKACFALSDAAWDQMIYGSIATTFLNIRTSRSLPPQP
jgi:hypothetical protein